METIKENLLLHPVRMRIMSAIAGRQVTAQQLANELPDIPQATLYRNLRKLAAAGLLNVVRERRVHNTIEKTYALPEQGVMVTADDLKNYKPEDYLRLFTRYLGQLLGTYVRYLQKGDADLARDPVLFQMVPMVISYAEGQELGQALQNLLLPYTRNEPSPGRRRVILGLTSIPDVGAGENQDW